MIHVKESAIKKIVDELSLEDLNKVLCERCVRSGMSPQESLYNPLEMDISTYTGDLICKHCSIVEDDEGFEKIPPEDLLNSPISQLIILFERYRGERRKEI